jgi:3D (Asp-Asp-Asp) domain-containing protein
VLDEKINYEVIVRRVRGNYKFFMIPIVLSIALGWFVYSSLFANQNKGTVSTSPGKNTQSNRLVSSPTVNTFFRSQENPTATMLPTAIITQTVTSIPSIASTPTDFSILTSNNISKFTYSFYDPSLGGSNCLTWDSTGENCVSKMSSGYDYWEYYDVAVACPPEYPTGTIIRVLSPPVLAHDWICLDTGGTIVGNRLDFLQHIQVLPWYAEINAVVIYPCDSCR